MRLIKFLSEAATPQKLESWENVVEKCPITTKANVVIYRGFNTNFEYGWCSIDTNRAPKDSSKVWHDLLDSGFVTVFGKPLRSCSVFTTGDRIFAKVYGEAHLIYPSDDFAVYWSDDIDDCYEVVGSSYDKLIRKMPKNSVNALSLLWILFSRKDQPSSSKILRQINNFELNKFVEENFPDELKKLENKMLPDLTVKNIMEKFPNCVNDFVKTFYKSGNTIQALQHAAKTRNEMMITGSYYCWGPI